jgi:SAM-dependent methyltransferase
MKINKKHIKKTNPVHIDIYALSWLCKQKGNITLSPKADGIYTEVKLNNHIFQAEYIKDINIYLIFDILTYPIKHSNTLIDRCKWITKLHPSTKDVIHNQITTIDQLLDDIKCNTQLFQNYIDTTTDEIRWFPKITYHINIDPNIFLSVLDTNIDDILLYKTDGWITTSLKYIGKLSSQIYKYKPKNELTIDILHDDGKWYGIDNNKQLLPIDNIKNNIATCNKIYRCYWDNNIWIPNEVRDDKVYPNNITIINELSSLHKNYWSASTLHYYNDTIDKLDDQYIDYLQIQRTIFKNIILNIINKLDVKSIIDVGCGKGHILKFIKSKNITLVDIDPSNIFVLKNKHHKNLYICSDMNNYDLYLNTQYDMIIFNNSLHYMEDLNNFIIHMNNCCRYIYIHGIDADMIRGDFMYNDIHIMNFGNNIFNFKYPWKSNKFNEKILSFNEIHNIFKDNNWELIEYIDNDFHNNEFIKIHKYAIFQNNNIKI